jgi:hypothetical protein
MIDEKQLLITAQKYAFVLSIKANKDNKGHVYQHVLRMGGKVVPECVTIIVNAPTEDERMRMMLDPEVAVLDSVKTNPKCSYAAALEPVHGTHVMLTLALMIVKRNFRHVKYVALDDASYFECASGTHMSMAHYQLAMYGKTWYERRFGARLNRHHELYRITADQMTQQGKPGGDELFDRYISGNEDYTKVYQASSTFCEFFNGLKRQLGKDFCDATIGWLPDFVNAIVKTRIHTKWVIEVGANHDATFSIKYNILKDPQNVFPSGQGGGSMLFHEDD